MPLAARQVEGSIVLVVITSLVYVAAFFLLRYPSPPAAVPYSDGSLYPVIVGLTGDTDHKGIYFVPEKTTIADFLKIAEVEDAEDFVEKKTAELSTGMRVNIGNRLTIGEMGAAGRLIFNIPIDVNRVSLADLVLVPGIGEKTAQRIVYLRESSGRFEKLEDLMKVPGIKEKKLARLKEYLYVGGQEN
ncbi:MAG: helix-hairpin-helix domain-containing protein [Syntrophales bacterium]|nr:helix-hairpin-helix domain-containing protein [Syntrophales bacterium]